MAKTRITNFRLEEDAYATFMMLSKKRQASANSTVNDLIRVFNKNQCAKLGLEPVTYAQWSAQNPKQHNKGIRKKKISK